MKWTAMVIVALGALLIGTFVADVWAGSGLNGFPSLKPVHYLNLGRDGYDLSSAKRERRFTKTSPNTSTWTSGCGRLPWEH